MSEQAEQKKNGAPTNRLEEQAVPISFLPPPPNLQQLQAQQNMMQLQGMQQVQQQVAFMQEMGQAVQLASKTLGATQDLLPSLIGFASLEGQRFEMHETITYTIQD